MLLVAHSRLETKKKGSLQENILALLNRKYGIVEEDLISSELELVPLLGPETSELTEVWSEHTGRMTGYVHILL